MRIGRYLIKLRVYENSGLTVLCCCWVGEESACQIKESLPVAVRSVFAHPLLDQSAADLYQSALGAVRVGLDVASLGLAATAVNIKAPVANIFWARV